MSMLWQEVSQEKLLSHKGSYVPAGACNTKLFMISQVKSSLAPRSTHVKSDTQLAAHIWHLLQTKSKRSWLPNSKQLWVSNTHVKHVPQIKSKPCFQQHTCNISSQGHGCLCKNYIRFTCGFGMYHNHKNFEK